MKLFFYFLVLSFLVSCSHVPQKSTVRKPSSLENTIDEINLVELEIGTTYKCAKGNKTFFNKTGVVSRLQIKTSSGNTYNFKPDGAEDELETTQYNLKVNNNTRRMAKCEGICYGESASKCGFGYNIIDNVIRDIEN